MAELSRVLSCMLKVLEYYGALSTHRRSNMRIWPFKVIATLSVSLLVACGDSSGSTLIQLDVTSKLQASAIGCTDAMTGAGGFFPVIKDGGEYDFPVIKDGEEYDDGSKSVSCTIEGDGRSYVFIYKDAAEAKSNIDRLCVSEDLVDGWRQVKKFVWGDNWVGYLYGGVATEEDLAKVLGGTVESLMTHCTK